MENGIVQASSCARLPEDAAHFANRDQSRWWWMALCGAPVTGWDLDREKFIGGYHGFHNPAAVETGRCSNSEGFSDNGCGGLQAEIELAPGETRDLIVLLGVGRDGLGYRDSVQDVLGAVAAVPAQARERLELMITAQEATGSARAENKPWLHQPGQMPSVAPHYRSDDCLWLFNAVPAYVAETGDVAFYGKVLPYSDTGEDTVVAHLRRALEFNIARTGRHGLPAGLDADWND